MADPLSIAGSLASLAGLGTTFAEWWKKRRGDKKKATLQHYLEWLRRRDQADLIQQIKESQEAIFGLEHLIDDLKTASADQATELLMRLQEQGNQLDSIDEKLAAIGKLSGRFGKQMSQVTQSVREILARLPAQSARSDEEQEFEERYRKAIAKNLDEVELFGVDLAPKARQQTLSAAYISLSLGSVNGHGGAGPTAAKLVFDGLSPRAGRLLIRGDAGSGKSTLMRWAAIQAALGDDEIQNEQGDRSKLLTSPKYAWHLAGVFDWIPADRIVGSEDDVRDLISQTAWTRRVPFLISVRTCKKGKFPPIEQYPIQCAEEIGPPPPGWTRRVLEEGRAMLLIDGIDETPPSYRSKIRKQVKRLTQTYPHCYFILTTRPSAVEQDWLADLGFRESLVAPLTGDDRDRFVDKWHEAVQNELAERGKHENLEPLATQLKAELRDNPGVALLASTPLLAAMICALYRDRRQKLPAAQYELVEALCHMLVFRRERESGLDVSEFPPRIPRLDLLSAPQHPSAFGALSGYAGAIGAGRGAGEKEDRRGAGVHQGSQQNGRTSSARRSH